MNPVPTALVLGLLLPALPVMVAETGVDTPAAKPVTAPIFTVGEGAKETTDAARGAPIERADLGALLKFGSVTAPGRYRLKFRARWDDPTTAAVAVVTPGPRGLPLLAAPQTRLCDAAGGWKWLSIDFEVEAGAGALPELDYPYIIRDAPRGARTSRMQIERASVTLEKVGTPVVLSWARPVKLRYKTGDAGALETRPTNASNGVQTVQLSPVVQNAGERNVGAIQTLTLQRRETKALRLPFFLPAKEGGYAAFADCPLLEDWKGASAPLRLSCSGVDAPFFSPTTACWLWRHTATHCPARTSRSHADLGIARRATRLLLRVNGAVAPRARPDAPRAAEPCPTSAACCGKPKKKTCCGRFAPSTSTRRAGLPILPARARTPGQFTTQTQAVYRIERD